MTFYVVAGKRKRKVREEFVHITFVACQHRLAGLPVCVFTYLSLSLSISLGANNPSKCNKTLRAATGKNANRREITAKRPNNDNLPNVVVASETF